ncbi:hypothetical protein LRP67_17290 [Nocardioides sp. cx-169]|uniref:hypothetical protein n=1 Tax=Nocardioides sp. cx-169 TaxID=2899080 RepID=UPI001E36A295|nr:hypothetical protein [Nocardioides sp. cx-169]MCD4535847.1 hypothetical protein [Nocardioides sp. cx-169]
MSKQLVLALAAGTTAFAAVVGSAATLGGITSDDLGADTSVVASCDTDGIAVEYSTTYVEMTGVYEVDEVTLTGIDQGCAGQSYKVTLAGGASSTTSLLEKPGTLPAGPVAPATWNDELTLPIDTSSTTGPVDGVDAEAVENIAVVISGA